jgi:shikimate dehydrogenase
MPGLIASIHGDPWTKRFAVVGQPISHSRSPQIFDALARAAGITLAYERVEIAPEDFDAAFADARENFDGWNVTAPHKARALANADDASHDARIVGAANVISFRDGEAHAANTDVGGVIALLRSKRIDPTGQVVTVLGAGGAARATVVALAQMDARRIVIANRTIERARTLIADLHAHVYTTELEAADPVASSIVINATSDGGAVADAVEACMPGGWCVDLQYKPVETPFVLAARAAGHNAVNGTHMLVAQAIATFYLWFGDDVRFSRGTELQLGTIVEAP